MHIGDTYNDRYHVVNKLGSGTSATVWLARDFDAPVHRYVALKFGAARDGEKTLREARMLSELTPLFASDEGPSAFIHLLDTFWVEGPNGRHLVLVTDFAGPPVKIASLRRLRLKLRSLKFLCWHLLRGFARLHEHGVVHGGKLL